MSFKTFWKKKSFKSWLLSTVPVLSLLLVIALVLTFNDFLYQTLNSVFSSERLVLLSGDPAAYRYYEGEYKSKEEVLAAANTFNEEIVEEGIVLLKNEDGALPLSADSRVTVFGKNSVDLVLGGSGSNAGGSGGKSVKTLYDSLSAAGITYNPEMKKFYEDNGRSGDGRPAPPDMNSTITGLTGFPTGETPVEKYDAAARDSWKDYPDAAIVVLSRIGGEGFDLPRSMFWDGSGYQNWAGTELIPGARGQGDHYLQLDRNETDMIQTAAENFEKVIVVLNAPTAMELGFLDDAEHYAYSEKIKACLWLGTPGNSGTMALGRVLTGEVDPSGRTVDIYARDFKKDPSWANFGNNLKADGNRYRDESGQLRNAYFVEYEEGIYVGYRYYETRDVTETAAGNGDWYRENVVFPFGYGLSYTQFEWTVQEPTEALTADGTVRVEVEVKNVGDRAGKDVVELYYSAPYDASKGIEKAHVALGAFAKTKEIPAGGTDTVTLEFSVRDMAYYDYADADGDGYSGYALDGGEYTFYIARSSHDREHSFTLTLGESVQYPTDSKTGNQIGNLFGDVSDRIAVYMSREDFEGTFPAPPDADRAVLTADELKQFSYTLKDLPTDPWYTEQMPQQSQRTLSREETAVKLYDLIGKDFDDETWDRLLDQLTVAQMRSLIEMGNYHTEPIENIDKPLTTDPDGPMGYALFMGNDAVYDTCYYASESLMASTWNVELAKRFGEMIGEESLVGNAKGDGRTYAGWYAPACNLHRSPFGGRNFEYYSEDAVLSAEMSVSVIRGAKSKGVYAYLKHFALNDQETNRDTNGIAVWANEQAMRELYFLPFERAVKEGGATAIMSSFNRIGFTWAGGSYDLLTRLLRDEWGFRGMVVTDYNLLTYMNADQMIRAGGDIVLSQSKKLQGYEDATSVAAIRRAAKNILYTVANSNAMNGFGEGNEWGYARPVWFIWMWVAFAVVAAGFLIWGAFVIAKIAHDRDTDASAPVPVPISAGESAEAEAETVASKERAPAMTGAAKLALCAIALFAAIVLLAEILLMALPKPQPSTGPLPAYVSGMTLTLDGDPVSENTVTLEAGSSARLGAIVETHGEIADGVSFSVENDKIAEVSADGILTAKAKGETPVTVTSLGDASVSGTVLVRVTGATVSAHAVTVVNGRASVSSAAAGTTVILTADNITGKTFSHWQFSVADVETSGNMFRMPDCDVTAEAIYTTNLYSLTLQGATFADGTSVQQLEYGQAFPADVRFEIPATKCFFGWKDAETGEVLVRMPARDTVLKPWILSRGAQLEMGTNGYDHGTGTAGGSCTETMIGSDAAKQLTISEGQSLARIKPGGVIGTGNDLYVCIVLRNDNEFAVSFAYEIEFYGVIWGTGVVTLQGGETATYAIVVDGLAAGENPYHRFAFSEPVGQEIKLSFCGFIMQEE